mmetsp:Transcript_23554/g.70360  ORF Transcript_23554/g.70360 Transcript_23554/m.70360 type:complete len:233 (-) Transcript_23554:349-1047(-)
MHKTSVRPGTPSRVPSKCLRAGGRQWPSKSASLVVQLLRDRRLRRRAQTSSGRQRRRARVHAGQRLRLDGGEHAGRHPLLQLRVRRWRARGDELVGRCRLSDAARDGVRVIVRLCRHLSDGVHHRRERDWRISRLGLHLKDGDMARAVEGVELPVAVPPAEARERLLDGGAGRVRLLEQHQVLPAGEGPLDQCRRSRRLLVAALDADPCLVLEGDVGSLLPPPDSAALVLVW